MTDTSKKGAREHLIKDFSIACRRMQLHSSYSQDELFSMLAEINYLQEFLIRLDERFMPKINDADKNEPYFSVPADAGTSV